MSSVFSIAYQVVSDFIISDVCFTDAEKHRYLFFAFGYASLIIVILILLSRWKRQKIELESKLGLSPLVTISDPIGNVENANASGKGWRMFSLKIENSSSVPIENIRVKIHRFNDRFQKEEGSLIGLTFSLRSERTISQEQPFTLAPHTTERAKIVTLNESDNSSSVELRCGLDRLHFPKLPRNLFPYDLTIQVTANNLTTPEERKFKVFIDDSGILHMETV